MYKWIILLLAAIGITETRLQAQIKSSRLAGYAGADKPLGIFNQTHLAGIQAGVYYSPGFTKARSSPQITYILNSGFRYYLGKREMVSGYSYRYGGYTAWDFYGGALYKFRKPVRVSCMAGPALSLYRKNSRLNLGAALDLHWQLNARWGISPGVSLLKESGAAPLWAAGIKAVRYR